jgi:hypothetical protein
MGWIYEVGSRWPTNNRIAWRGMAAVIGYPRPPDVCLPPVSLLHEPRLPRGASHPITIHCIAQDEVTTRPKATSEPLVALICIAYTYRPDRRVHHRSLGADSELST